MRTTGIRAGAAERPRATPAFPLATGLQLASETPQYSAGKAQAETTAVEQAPAQMPVLIQVHVFQRTHLAHRQLAGPRAAGLFDTPLRARYPLQHNVRAFVTESRRQISGGPNRSRWCRESDGRAPVAEAARDAPRCVLALERLGGEKKGGPARADNRTRRTAQPNPTPSY